MQTYIVLACRSIPETRDANLAALYVSRSHQRQDVGTLLVAEVARLAGSHGAVRL